MSNKYWNKLFHYALNWSRFMWVNPIQYLLLGALHVHFVSFSRYFFKVVPISQLWVTSFDFFMIFIDLTDYFSFFLCEMSSRSLSYGSIPLSLSWLTDLTFKSIFSVLHQSIEVKQHPNQPMKGFCLSFQVKSYDKLNQSVDQLLTDFRKECI